ncbi:glycoside hydrolase family 2 [Pedobacter frigiditerrae]|uniref:beta-galactosidase n=1 Tax=Pedobacter frigiditerrae TaxID=2530452 RepID=A0A4R0MY09_9SPHI|nr:glycoside hydrolase family 2 TIM barrel-domain containing protein [Pedobacter frigiditerrae]TCC91783.1 glycoside hydrolase family 2 [Pedobacter frigiditerrae]
MNSIKNIKIKTFILLLQFSLSIVSNAQETQYQYLSGVDKDHTVSWDFMVNTGMNSGKWSKIKVPSNWELQGFGTYNYFSDSNNPNEFGWYKQNFESPASLNKEVFIVFEGAMTDTEVKINGKLAGPIHQGGFYRFKYNITDKLNPTGTNLLEIKVYKKSTNASVNKAEREGDYWQFGGIYRPVYLEIVPKKFIDRVAVNATADGTLMVDVFTQGEFSSQKIEVELKTLDGKKIGSTQQLIDKQGNTRISTRFKDIKKWNPEAPYLYNLTVSLVDQKKIVHQVKQKIGFRTVELRPADGIYVNDVKIKFKGVNRHSFWPESGRALSKQISIDDVKLIKQMNMNAVRMSHYPPDQHFLEVCDSLGLFVIDELTGWQKSYDTPIGKKLVKELVVRDVNHPSIVIWANGNEGGWNRELDDDFDLYDPQKRMIIHPWEKFRGTDTRHYPDYNYMVNAMLYSKEVFFPTEFMHGNYDGGMAAGLQDFWDMMLKHPYGAGGFLWSFADEGVVRTDKNGAIDLAGDSAPDGIVGPHHEKEGSFNAVRKIWSPIVVNNKYIPTNFDGKLFIENRYLYTNLNQCTFKWELKKFIRDKDELKTMVKASDQMILLASVNPGETTALKLNLPSDWKKNDVLIFTAIDPKGKEIYTWSWSLKFPEDVIKSDIVLKEFKTQPQAILKSGKLNVLVNELDVQFDETTGLLDHVISKGKQISLSKGPILAQARSEMKLQYFKNYVKDGNVIVESAYKGEEWLNVKWTFTAGMPVKLDYEYAANRFDQQLGYNFMGITFNYPEQLVKGAEFMGNGPERVYKNRMDGAEFGLWKKEYNDGITGEKFDYPEFKGYHGPFYWVKLANSEADFTVYTANQNVFLQLFKPAYAKATRESVKAAFPAGDLGFMNAIAPIGTKFQKPEFLGPTSQQNIQLNYDSFKGTLWFDFK